MEHLVFRSKGGRSKEDSKNHKPYISMIYRAFLFIYLFIHACHHPKMSRRILYADRPQITIKYILQVYYIVIPNFGTKSI